MVAIKVVARDELPGALSGADRNARLQQISLEQLQQIHVPPRGFALAYFGHSKGDPLPDALIVNDREYEDALGWLSAYLVNLAPLTQWCRVWRQSDLIRISEANEIPTLMGALGPWVGSILSELALQGSGSASVKDASGNAAMNTAGFCAAREIAVWGLLHNPLELAKRYDSLSIRLRERPRPITARQLLPIWAVLSPSNISAELHSIASSLEPFRSLFQAYLTGYPLDQDEIVEAARLISASFDLLEIAECSSGPQSRRVIYLDKVANKVRTFKLPTSTSEAIIGFCASLIDPGAVVMPELLRQYIGEFPASTVWAGTFAGLWSPIRALSEFNGLGRLISKSLLKQADLLEKPSADIAFEELDRWLAGADRGRVSVRGMVLRSLAIEIVPGVVCPFPSGRIAEPAIDERNASRTAGARQRSLDLRTSAEETSRPNDRGSNSTNVTDLAEALLLLQARIEKLERADAERLSKGAAKSSRRQSASGAKKT